MGSHAEVLRIMRVGYEAHPFPNEHTKEMIAALDAAITALSSQGWLSIESAPRDGRWVNLLSSEGQDVGAWRDTRYCMIGAPQGSYGPGWVDQRNCLPISGEFEPTHWQPLPPPPAGEKE